MRIMYKALLAVKNIITMRKTISILLNYINHEMNFKKHIRRKDIYGFVLNTIKRGHKHVIHEL